MEWIIRTDRQNQRMKVEERFGKGWRSSHLISGKTLRLLVVYGKPLKGFESWCHLGDSLYRKIILLALYRTDSTGIRWKPGDPF